MLNEDIGSGEFGRVLKVRRKADDDDDFGSMNAKDDTVCAIKKSKSPPKALQRNCQILFVVLQDANVLTQENLRRTSSRLSGRVEVSQVFPLPDPRDIRSSPAVPFGMTTIRSILHRPPLQSLGDFHSTAPTTFRTGIPSNYEPSL